MQNKITIYRHREWQTVILFGLVLLLVAGYILIINRVVVHALSKQATAKAVTTLTGEVSRLETRVQTLENQITPELATAYGFLETAPLLVSWRSYDRPQ